MLPPFRIRQIWSTANSPVPVGQNKYTGDDISELDGRRGLVMITRQDYHEILTENPKAVLTYMDEDDGEIITIGSPVELMQRLTDPLSHPQPLSPGVAPPLMRGKWFKGTPASNPGVSYEPVVQMFDIKPSPDIIHLWKEVARGILPTGRLLGYTCESPRVESEHSDCSTVGPYSFSSADRARLLMPRLEASQDLTQAEDELPRSPASEESLQDGLESYEDEVSSLRVACSEDGSTDYTSTSNGPVYSGDQMAMNDTCLSGRERQDTLNAFVDWPTMEEMEAQCDFLPVNKGERHAIIHDDVVPMAADGTFSRDAPNLGWTFADDTTTNRESPHAPRPSPQKSSSSFVPSAYNTCQSHDASQQCFDIHSPEGLKDVFTALQHYPDDFSPTSQLPTDPSQDVFIGKEERATAAKSTRYEMSQPMAPKNALAPRNTTKEHESSHRIQGCAFGDLLTTEMDPAMHRYPSLSTESRFTNLVQPQHLRALRACEFLAAEQQSSPQPAQSSAGESSASDPYAALARDSKKLEEIREAKDRILAMYSGVCRLSYPKFPSQEKRKTSDSLKLDLQEEPESYQDAWVRELKSRPKMQCGLNDAQRKVAWNHDQRMAYIERESAKKLNENKHLPSLSERVLAHKKSQAQSAKSSRPAPKIQKAPGPGFQSPIWPAQTCTAESSRTGAANGLREMKEKAAQAQIQADILDPWSYADARDHNQDTPESFVNPEDHPEQYMDLFVSNTNDFVRARGDLGRAMRGVGWNHGQMTSYLERKQAGCGPYEALNSKASLPPVPALLSLPAPSATASRPADPNQAQPGARLARPFDPIAESVMLHRKRLIDEIRRAAEVHELAAITHRSQHKEYRTAEYDQADWLQQTEKNLAMYKRNVKNGLPGNFPVEEPSHFVQSKPMTEASRGKPTTFQPSPYAPVEQRLPPAYAPGRAPAPPYQPVPTPQELKIRECVARLRLMGFGANEKDGHSQLRLLVEACDGDLERTLDFKSCVEALQSMGYGANSYGGLERLIVYVQAGEADLNKTIDVIMEDFKASSTRHAD